MSQAKTADVETLNELFREAVRLHNDSRLDEAAPLYRQVLAGAPHFARGWANYGALLRRQRKFRPAIAAIRKALELDPELTIARSNLAHALADIGDCEAAIPIRRALLEAEPDNPDRIRDLGIVLRGALYHEETIQLVDEAEARLPAEGLGECLLQRAFSRLMLGDYAQGFADFESRYHGDEVSLPENPPWPRWTGEPIEGKRLIVLPEQGLGDAIVTSRFLPQVKAMGAHVAMVVKRPLRRLLAGAVGLDRMLDRALRTAEYDYYCPNMSLPHLAGMPEDGPPPAPRLVIPEDSRARAARILRPFARRFRIGVVWTGSPTYRANHRRSVAPERFAPLAEMPGVQLFSLYKGEDHDAFLESGMAGVIHDTCATDRDLADTAAVIAGMHMLITTDTAVVHIAGSLGKPVWNLLPHESFWLYGLGETTLWYPSMRIFRQQSPGDWDGVFARVETALAEHLEERK